VREKESRRHSCQKDSPKKKKIKMSVEKTIPEPGAQKEKGNHTTRSGVTGKEDNGGGGGEGSRRVQGGKTGENKSVNGTWPKLKEGGEISKNRRKAMACKKKEGKKARGNGGGCLPRMCAAEGSSSRKHNRSGKKGNNARHK